MKTITINVSEPTLALLKQHAKERDRTTSELIREAMEDYVNQRFGESKSVRELQPLSLKKVKRPVAAGDDILGEMLDD